MNQALSHRPTAQGSRHADYIYSVVDGTKPMMRTEEFAASWERSISQYGLDPAGDPVPRVLTPRELRERLEPVEDLVRSARCEIDRLYNLTRGAGYAVVLSDSTGVAMDFRGEVMPAIHLKDLGSCVGGVWSEDVHGTNGIGTCIAEQRAVTVHRAHHFRSQHTHLSCSGAPIFGINGKLIAALDVSSVDPSLSEGAHALTGTLTTATARAIEERFFREQFHRQWVIAIAPRGDGPGALLAVDDDQRILAADRTARVMLCLNDQMLQNGTSMWSVFERDRERFRVRHSNDFFMHLSAVGTGEVRSALVTPPCNSRASLVLHAHPRLDLLEVAAVTEPRPPVCGGLSPGILRRVRLHIAQHLTERIQLADLATVAGLSVYHFAREFKRTVGVSPHSYVTQRRVEKAQEMLALTDLPLSDIALAAGFFDQSHLTRHLREFAGVTPAEYRWSQR